MAEGQRWTREQVDALIDAYSDVRVQENVEGIATNKEVYGQVQKLMKDDHSGVVGSSWPTSKNVSKAALAVTYSLQNYRVEALPVEVVCVMF